MSRVLDFVAAQEHSPPKRSVGRPLKEVKASDKRLTIGIRVTPELKLRLMRDAEKTGRSLSQTAELRLEQSYDREETIKIVLATLEEIDMKKARLRIVNMLWRRAS